MKKKKTQITTTARTTTTKVLKVGMVNVQLNKIKFCMQVVRKVSFVSKVWTPFSTSECNSIWSTKQRYL